MPVLTGATATVTAAAGAGTFTTGAAVVLLSGATARVMASAGLAVFTPATDVALEGATAEITALARAGALTSPGGSTEPGDSVTAPITLGYSGITSQITQTFNVNLGRATADVYEPNPMAHTVWFTVSTTSEILLLVTLTTPATIHVYDETFDLLATDPGTFTLGAGRSVYVRLGSTTSVQTVATFTATPVTGTGVVKVDDVERTPAALLVSGGNFTPDSAATISILGTGVTTTAATDSSGVIWPRAVDLPALPAGLYVVQIVTGSQSGTGTFTVLNDPLATTGETPDGTVTVSSTVGRWMLKDPYTGGRADYEFPINPSEMTTPYAPKIYQTDTSTQGAQHIWEGDLRAHEWTFRGYLETQAFHDELAAWQRLGRRFLLRDHRGRWWVVTFVGFDPSPIRNLGKPWAHRYQMRCLIYGRYEG